MQSYWLHLNKVPFSRYLWPDHPVQFQHVFPKNAWNKWSCSGKKWHYYHAKICHGDFFIFFFCCVIFIWPFYIFFLPFPQTFSISPHLMRHKRISNSWSFSLRLTIHIIHTICLLLSWDIFRSESLIGVIYSLSLIESKDRELCSWLTCVRVIGENVTTSWLTHFHSLYSGCIWVLPEVISLSCQT